MLNLEETISISYNYNIQKDLYIKGIFYIIASIIFLDLLRSQISEISLLQLVPGYYLLLIFISFVLLLGISNFGFRIPLKVDIRNKFGTKTLIRASLQTQFNISVFLLIGFFSLSLNTIIPIGLDSFDSYDQGTLTNLWSFDQVLALESILVTVLIILSQLPLVLLNTGNTEKDKNNFIKYWKDFSFSCFLIAGIITPTIDGYTQISLSLSAITLYILVIYLVEKYIYIKFNGTSSLNF